MLLFICLFAVAILCMVLSDMKRDRREKEHFKAMGEQDHYTAPNGVPIGDALDCLYLEREMMDFDPNTGEDVPPNESCRELRDSIDCLFSFLDAYTGLELPERMLRIIGREGVPDQEPDQETSGK